MRPVCPRSTGSLSFVMACFTPFASAGPAHAVARSAGSRNTRTHAPRVVCRAQLDADRPSAVSQALQRVAHATITGVTAFSLISGGAVARPEGVNRPELLPKGEVTPVIDVAGFLTPSEEQRMRTEIESLERDTGFKLRVLAQNYPETPGLAIRDYWGVDDTTVVFVADPTFGDICNFNVGQAVDLEVPRSFWSRLAGKFGNKFFWQEKGEASAILNAVSAIDTCLREPSGRAKCATVQEEFEKF